MESISNRKKPQVTAAKPHRSPHLGEPVEEAADGGRLRTIHQGMNSKKRKSVRLRKQSDSGRSDACKRSGRGSKQSQILCCL